MVKPRYVGLSDMSNAFPGRTDRAADPRLKVFISYSRKDSVFAEELLSGLEAAGFEPYLDKRDIAPGEVWEARLGRLILEADTVVYVISPDAVASKRCVWEIEETERLAKRLLPVVCRAVEEAAVPERLRRLNYIYFDKPNAFGTGLKQLARALNTDLSWLREHTHMLEEATRWHERGRIDALLLRGSALDEAKSWLSLQPKNMPEPTEVQRAFIAASDEAEVARNSKERQELAERASMQEAREGALRREEIALKEVTEAQRRRARNRNVFVAVALVLSGLLGIAGYLAKLKGDEAVVQNRIANEVLQASTSLIKDYSDRFELEVGKNPEAVSVFKKGAELGDLHSMAMVAWLHVKGEGVPKNYTIAREWYEKADAKGNAVATTSLGVIYENGHDVPVDLGKAFKFYEKAAKNGQVDGIRNLGNLYLRGKGVAKDNAKAAGLLEKAANAGNAAAMNTLGLLYRAGKGVKRDLVKARELLEVAADKGNTNAMINLGDFYRNGQGVKQDYVKAREWYEKAADKGEPDALLKIAGLHSRGLGVKQNHGEAMKWYERALNRAEAAEQKSAGKPGPRTAEVLSDMAWGALYARDFAKALAAAERAHKISEDVLLIETNRAHALMFSGRVEEARALYLAHKGKNLGDDDDPENLWEKIIAKDFAELRKSGSTHPLIDEVKKALGIDG